jgi:hypothetical protein
MLRTAFHLCVAAAFFLVPQTILAGGPPWLSVPIEGVTAANANSCGDLLAAKLKDKLYEPAGQARAVYVQQRSKQWYAMFYMRNDIALHEIQTALKGSGFSVPQERLHLFGHIILEIDGQSSSPKKLLADLESLQFVSVDESKTKGDRLLVTLNMPYPTEFGRPDGEAVEWNTFKQTSFGSNEANSIESAATPAKLPSYAAIRDVVAKHQAKLTDIRWSVEHHCRPLGCVAPSAQPLAISAR